MSFPIVPCTGPSGVGVPTAQTALFGSGRPVQFSALRMEIVRYNNLTLIGMTQGFGALRMEIVRYNNLTIIGMTQGSGRRYAQ